MSRQEDGIPAARQPRHRAVRRHRRPGQAQAAARVLPPARGRPAAAGVPHHRVLAEEVRADHRAVPGARRAGVRRVLHHQAHRSVLAVVRGTTVVRARRAGPRHRTEGCRPAGGQGDRRLAPAAVPPGRAARRVHLGRGHARRGGPGQGRPGDRREAVRRRPGVGAGAEPVGARGLRRVAGVPHRPLPGQGIGRQHPRVPVRERAVRADLEPAVHPLRADRRAGERCRSRAGPRSTTQPAPTGT